MLSLSEVEVLSEEQSPNPPEPYHLTPSSDAAGI